MEFCPDCKSIMIPKQGVMVCRKCGRKVLKKESGPRVSRTNQLDRRFGAGGGLRGLPTTRMRPGCGNVPPTGGFGSCGLNQSEVRFFRCTKCSNTWREVRLTGPRR